MWEALAELREALGELWEGLEDLWEALYIDKLPINRTSGHYVNKYHRTSQRLIGARGPEGRRFRGVALTSQSMSSPSLTATPFRHRDIFAISTDFQKSPLNHLLVAPETPGTL